MAVLNELFNGEINPKERIDPADPEYTRINEEVDAVMLRLQECLDQD